jgi:hypothetical protein
MESMNSEDIKITDEDINKVYRISLAIFIIGCILVVILYFNFIDYLSFKFNITRFLIRLLHIILFLIGPILMVIIGLYGIIIYNFKPEKLKTFLKKRKTPETQEKLMKIKTKMGRKNLIIWLSLIGGLWLLIFGIVNYILHPGGGWYLPPPYTIPLIIFSVIAIVGAIVELKNLITGSIVCLISGVAILITLNIYAISWFVYTMFPIIFLIVGGTLGILEARKEKEN